MDPLLDLRIRISLHIINNINYYWSPISWIILEDILSGKLYDQLVKKYIHVYYTIVGFFFKTGRVKITIMYKYNKFQKSYFWCHCGLRSIF